MLNFRDANIQELDTVYLLFSMYFHLFAQMKVVHQKPDNFKNQCFPEIAGVVGYKCL